MQKLRLIAASLRSSVDDAAFVLCLAVFAAALFAVAGSAMVDGLQSPNEVAATATGQPEPGALAGRSADGAPVYRLPAISVSASRTVEMARIEQDDRRARTTDAAGDAS
jgi:hypothetical protein